MTSTHPSAALRISRVLRSEEPRTSPLKSEGFLMMTSPLDRRPKSHRMRPYSLATVVLPVPGLPRNTRLSITSSSLSSLSSRSAFLTTRSNRLRTERLTSPSPSIASSSRRASHDSSLPASALGPSTSSLRSSRMLGRFPSIRSEVILSACLLRASSNMFFTARAFPNPTLPRILPRRRTAMRPHLGSLRMKALLVGSRGGSPGYPVATLSGSLATCHTLRVLSNS
mmetsp:Transcript_28319/g.69356  ORF Transcript_28319/g.69356 Transcript_28319/m.69356 type:complete len:226 (+) Transcript_28319:456-1133(+)